MIASALLSRRPDAHRPHLLLGPDPDLQAIVQPTLTQPFPEPTFFVFWLKHVRIVWGAVYLTLTLRNGPDWRGYRRTVGWTFVWLFAVLGRQRRSWGPTTATSTASRAVAPCSTSWDRGRATWWPRS